MSHIASVPAFLAILLILTACEGSQQAIEDTPQAALTRDSGPLVLKDITAAISIEQRLQLARASGGVRLVAPADWPSTQPWRPLRNFGPFYRGSHFGHIQVRLERTGLALYHGDYFESHPDADIYRKYYGTTLPSEAAPALDFVPGSLEVASGFNDARLELQRIRYSSRYGGRVQLSFALIEDEFGSTGSLECGAMRNAYAAGSPYAYFNEDTFPFVIEKDGDVHGAYTVRARLMVINR